MLVVNNKKRRVDLFVGKCACMGWTFVRIASGGVLLLLLLSWLNLTLIDLLLKIGGFKRASDRAFEQKSRLIKRDLKKYWR